MRKLHWLIMSAVLAAAVLLAPPAIADHVSFSQGDVLAGVGMGKVNHYDSAGNLLEILDTRSNSVEQTGMCFDSRGNLYTTNWSAGSMTKFDNRGAVLAYPWGGPYKTRPETCAVDAAGNVYVGEVDGENAVRKFDSSGALLAVYRPERESRGVDGIDLAADQCTLYYTSEGNKVKRFDLCGNRQLPDLAVDLAGPCHALRIRENDEVMVTCRRTVYRLDPSGTVMQSYPSRNYAGGDIYAQNLDPDGTSFWTATYYTGYVIKIDIATGELLAKFRAPPNGYSMAGVAIYGELRAALRRTVVDKGRMTGGGHVAAGGARLSHGFSLDCDVLEERQQLQVNWGKGNKFHLERRAEAACYDEIADSDDADNDFDTIVGSGSGRYNGEPGAQATWTLTDAGEPGDGDELKITVEDGAGNVVLTAAGPLTGGNHKAHRK